MSKITLGNGKVLDGVWWSGDVCFSAQEVKASDFSGGLSGVVIEGTDEEFSAGPDLRGMHERMTVDRVWKWGKNYAFCLSDMEPPSDIEKLRADMDYIAMMGGVEL